MKSKTIYHTHNPNCSPRIYITVYLHHRHRVIVITIIDLAKLQRMNQSARAQGAGRSRSHGAAGTRRVHHAPADKRPSFGTGVRQRFF